MTTKLEYDLNDVRHKSLVEKIGDTYIQIMAFIKYQKKTYVTYKSVYSDKYWIEEVTNNYSVDKGFKGLLLDTIKDDKTWLILVEIVEKNGLNIPLTNR